MKINSTYTLLAGTALAVLLASCSKNSAPAKAPQGVAEVGDAIITGEALQHKLAERQRANRSAVFTANDRDAALEELVQFEALFAQASRAGWHTNAELLATFRRAVVAKHRENELSKLRPEQPGESEVRDYYEQNAAQFSRPEQIRAAVVLLELPAKSSAEKRSEHLARANELRAQAAQESAAQSHLGGLAQRHSIDQATRYAGGDFGWLTRSAIQARYGKEIVEALDALQKPGAISGVLETSRGLAFAKLIEHRPESRRPLAEVRDGIVHQLSRAKQAQTEREWLASARNSVAVKIHRAALESVPLPVRREEPPALPAAQTAQVNLQHP